MFHIDPSSGFCFGVQRAIATAERLLSEAGEAVYSVGDIVHNEREIERLRGLGLRVIDSRDLAGLTSGRVLFRAHGEPPSSYELVRRQGLALTDATCPVVLALQRRIRLACQRLGPAGGRVLLFGKRGHAEVIGLMAQTNGFGSLVENVEQALEVLDGLPTSAEVELFAQTTMNPDDYHAVAEALQRQAPGRVVVNHTICQRMAARADALALFARQHDVVLFVGGAKSSNSKVLFDLCRGLNPNTHFLTAPDELNPEWLHNATNVGITGATSTPTWLMAEIREKALVVSRGTVVSR